MTDLFEYAQKRRDRGMALAADAQDRVEPTWSDDALRAIETVARRQATVHVDDVLPLVSPPAHHNAWGSIWLHAIRAGVIVKTDRRRRSTDPKKHAHEYPVYASRLWRNA